MACLSSNRRPYHALLLIGPLLGFMGISEIYARAEIEVDGRVSAVEKKCQEPQHNRCVTTYVLQSKNGQRETYSAGPTDRSLRRNLPVGVYLDKRKWHLSYRVDNEEINDFPIFFYGGLLALSVVAVLSWLRLNRKWQN